MVIEGGLEYLVIEKNLVFEVLRSSAFLSDFLSLNLNFLIRKMGIKISPS